MFFSPQYNLTSHATFPLRSQTFIFNTHIIILAHAHIHQYKILWFFCLDEFNRIVDFIRLQIWFDKTKWEEIYWSKIGIFVANQC